MAFQQHHHDVPPRLGNGPAAKNPLRTALSFVAGLILLAAGFAFSLVVAAIVLSLGAIAAGYLWWKTRALRRQMQAHLDTVMQQHTAADVQGDVIEGEVVREERDARP